MENGLLETIYDVLTKPGMAMEQLGKEKRIGWSLVVFLLSTTLFAVAIYFAFQEGGGLRQAAILIQLLGNLAFWVSSTALIHFVAECWGARGSVLGLFTALGFAQVSQLLAVPLIVLSMLLPPQGANMLVTLTMLGVMVWIVFLDVAAVKGTYDVNTGKAMLILISPFLVMIAGIIMVFAVIGTTMWTERIL